MTIQGEYVPSKQDWVREQVERFESTNGAEASTLRDTGDPIVVITSIGAKSGKVRKNPVMRVEKDGKYVAVASKGGAPQHPEWYYNFVAHPVVDLQDGPDKKAYRARLLSGQERTQWWQYAVDTWPTYADYEKRTDREIPVFLLEPIDR
jgi:deazaflavin-dependent oxidoreductase (nitroreductase family)